MMKKNGFTLAEVLITLAIIGVVATLTLPALMTNVGEQQYKTALKKALNTLSEAGQMSQAMDGFDYSSFTTSTVGGDMEDEHGNVVQSLYSLLQRRTNMASFADGSTHKVAESNYSNNQVVYFRDGTSIIFNPSATSGTQGQPNGFAAIIDINGKKGPNLVSNCAGKDGKAATNTAAATHDISKCTGKDNKRIIKDQFPIRLVRGLAIPNNDAARWAATE